MCKYYIVYKITNKLDGKIYIGCHKTDELEDGYMGSGKYLKRAIMKHGIENFEKEILRVFDNSGDMFDMESMLVNREDPNTYNLKMCGNGGFDHIHESDFYGSEAHIIAARKGFNTTIRRHGLVGFSRMGLDALGKKHGLNYASVIGKRGAVRIKELYPDGVWMGRRHTEESKQKQSKAMRGRFTGKNNSQYGTTWVTDGENNKKIARTDVIPKGWRKGRKIKRVV